MINSNATTSTVYTSTPFNQGLLNLTYPGMHARGQHMPSHMFICEHVGMEGHYCIHVHVHVRVTKKAIPSMSTCYRDIQVWQV